MHPEIQAEIDRLNNSEAGKALARHAFKAAHQGGGLVNFERPDGKGGRVNVVSIANEDGWGPESLSEPVALVEDDGTCHEFPSLSAFIATLPSPFLSERLIARLSPLRRANLERRLTEHLERAQEEVCDARCIERGEPCGERELRLTKMLGRACCIITNLNAREARHG